MNPDVAPHLFVIFGATGDLTERKLLPALYKLMRHQEAAGQCYVLGASRSAWSDDEFRKVAVDALTAQGFPAETLAAWARTHLFYTSLGGEGDPYERLRDCVRTIEEAHGLPGNRVFYLALPPQTFPPTIEALGRVGLNRSAGWTRLVIEKPFGHDLASARALNELVHRFFDESQVYRIDHFLGKETVQNLLAFRFANVLFESVWSRDRIESVEITMAEHLGLEGRAGYYDRAGALRDMIQNHLTQLFTLIAMEVPSSFNAEAIHREKIKVLESVDPIGREDVVFGQYTPGELDGSSVPGYLDEDGVAEGSTTETFVALRLRVSNWRWSGVPFYLRTGKRLPKRLTQIAVRFHAAPISIFQSFTETCNINQNVLVITLQPDEGFTLQFEVKTPGDPFELRTQQLRFRYEDAFGAIPEAYETLLHDVVTGDQTLFVHASEAEMSWRLYEPVLARRSRPHRYAAGTWGPEAAQRLVGRWTYGNT